MMAGLRTWWVGRGRDDGAAPARVAGCRSPRARPARSSRRWCASGGRCAGCRESRSAVCSRGRLAGDSASARARQAAQAFGRSRSGCASRSRSLGIGAAGARALAGVHRSHRRRSSARARRCSSPACACVAFRLRRPPRSALDGHGWRPVSAPRAAQRRRPAGPQRARDRRHRVGDVHPHRRGRVPARRSAVATDRHSGVGGYALLVDSAAADRPRSEQPRRPRGARARDPASRCTIEPFRVLPGRRCELPESVRADESAGARASAGRSSTPGRFAFQASLRTDRRRARQPLAAARIGDLGAGRRAGDRRRQLDDLRAPQALGDDIVIDRRRPADPAAARRGARRQHLSGRAADVGRQLRRACFRSRRAIGSCWSTRRPIARRRWPPRSRKAPAISAPTPSDTTARLAEFHTVENTYLSTFQTLGGLGPARRHVGLAAVLLRNVLERRRELALLGAVGYRRGHMFTIVIAENAAAARPGVWRSARVCALRGDRAGGARARRPACRRRRRRRCCWLRCFVAGLLSSVVATRAALRTPLLEALRSE